MFFNNSVYFRHIKAIYFLTTVTTEPQQCIGLHNTAIN